MDESGDLGFGCGTAYFIVGFIAPASGKELSKAIKNFNAHLIRKGWNKAVEIKATNLWHAPKNPNIPSTYAYKNTPEILLPLGFAQRVQGRAASSGRLWGAGLGSGGLCLLGCQKEIRE